MLERDDIDAETAVLIEELKTNMRKQANIIKSSALLQLTGLTLLMVPFFAMDDSTTPATIPNWSKWVGGAGSTLDIVALGILISQINVKQDDHLKQIADSFNKNLINKYEYN